MRLRDARGPAMSGMACPRLIIAGVSSGVGKTTVTVALARALRRQGLRVATFKCGPDYLDPTYHARAAGRPSQNLDGWMMGREAVLRTFEAETREADLALIEGVMGLYDGASPTSEEGSTGQIAKWLKAPVVLVIDAGGMARTFAAVVHGLASFDAELQVCGVIANRVGSRGHLDLLRQALAQPLVLGGLPRDAEHVFAERHLGLHTASHDAVSEALLEHWADTAESWLPLTELRALAEGAASGLPRSEAAVMAPSKASRCRIGLAFDAAFHFYYPDNLRRLEEAGAELVRFSPLSDAALPEVDGLYIGGGYPEAHAHDLAHNQAMREAIARFARRGGSIYAECGGLIYLTRAIRTLDGKAHDMVGLLPYEACMFERLQALGYVEVETTASSLLGPAGLRFRGHQFRYSELTELAPDTSVTQAYSVRSRRSGQAFAEGYRVQDVLASYVHAHWASCPEVPYTWVERCTRAREGARS